MNTPSRRTAILGAAAAWAASPASGQPPSPTLDPFRFFAGRTRGVALLRIRGRRTPEAFTVAGVGEPSGDDGLILRQVITYDDARLERREWRIRRTPAGLYQIAGSDMLGAGRAQAVGPEWRVEWRRRGGPFGAVNVVQRLRLRPDGAIDNLGTFQRFGVTLALLQERITRLG